MGGRDFFKHVMIQILQRNHVFMLTYRNGVYHVIRGQQGLLVHVPLFDLSQTAVACTDNLNILWNVTPAIMGYFVVGIECHPARTFFCVLIFVDHQLKYDTVALGKGGFVGVCSLHSDSHNFLRSECVLNKIEDIFI